MVLGKATAAVEVDGRVAAVHFEVQCLGTGFARPVFGELEGRGADTLSAKTLFDEELVDPGAFAAVLEAVVEAEDDVADGTRGIADQPGEAEGRVVEHLPDAAKRAFLIERNGPGIVHLHGPHEVKQRFGIVRQGGAVVYGHNSIF